MADNNTILEKLEGLVARFEEVSTLITDPAVIADQKRYVKLTKEYKELGDLMNARKEYMQVLSGIEEAKEIIANETDAEMREMAREELDACQTRQPELEEELRKITEDYDPDVIHCFGTEYPHTLAVCRAYPHPERILLGIQGICSLCAEAYFADLPERVTRKVTFRDLVKRDSLRSQQEKFVRRGVMEREAIGLAGNITGRTAWDREVTTGWNPGAQ